MWQFDFCFLCNVFIYRHLAYIYGTIVLMKVCNVVDYESVPKGHFHLYLKECEWRF